MGLNGEQGHQPRVRTGETVPETPPGPCEDEKKGPIWSNVILEERNDLGFLIKFQCVSKQFLPGSPVTKRYF